MTGCATPLAPGTHPAWSRPALPFPPVQEWVHWQAVREQKKAAAAAAGGGAQAGTDAAATEGQGAVVAAGSTTPSEQAMAAAAALDPCVLGEGKPRCRG